MEVYLIRHTSPDIEKGICYGQSDLDLKATFDQEFQAVKEIIPHSFDAVYTSPLKRCAVMAQRLAPDIVRSDELKEIDFGDWEMKPWSEIDATKLGEWMANFVTYRVPNGESFEDLIARIDRFWQHVLEEKADRIAICTHAGPIRCLLGNILGLTPENYFKLEQSYGGVSKISLNGGHDKVDFINRV
ncbi:MAG: alpha-ribazole phosphatase [Verrucomicrobiota bacterium]